MDSPIPLLLYEDDWLLVFDKPSGLLSVPGRGEANRDNLVTSVQSRWPEALNVHRLDQATSGVIVMARSADVHRALSMQFAERQVEKKYIAIVAGHLDADQGSIDLPLMKDWPNRPRQKVDREQGQPSLTDWRVLEQYKSLLEVVMKRDTGSASVLNHEDSTGKASGTHAMPSFPATRLELSPLTGRSHQLRVHLLEIGHAIVGDRLYASPEIAAASERLLLHAQSLKLQHPITKKELDILAPAPF